VQVYNALVVAKSVVVQLVADDASFKSIVDNLGTTRDHLIASPMGLARLSPPEFLAIPGLIYDLEQGSACEYLISMSYCVMPL